VTKIQILALMHLHNDGSRGGMDRSSSHLSQAVSEAWALSLHWKIPGNADQEQCDYLWWTLRNLDRLNKPIQGAAPFIIDDADVSIDRMYGSHHSHRSQVMELSLRLGDLMKIATKVYKATSTATADGDFDEIPTFAAFVGGTPFAGFHRGHRGTFPPPVSPAPDPDFTIHSSRGLLLGCLNSLSLSTIRVSSCIRQSTSLAVGPILTNVAHRTSWPYTAIFVGLRDAIVTPEALTVTSLPRDLVSRSSHAVLPLQRPSNTSLRPPPRLRHKHTEHRHTGRQRIYPAVATHTICGINGYHNDLPRFSGRRAKYRVYLYRPAAML
jgi:hypothetical protein